MSISATLFGESGGDTDSTWALPAAALKAVDAAGNSSDSSDSDSDSDDDGGAPSSALPSKAVVGGALGGGGQQSENAALIEGLTKEELVQEAAQDEQERRAGLGEERSEKAVAAKARSKARAHSDGDNANTMFVGNVPLTATRKQLTKLFKGSGDVMSVRMRSLPLKDGKLNRKAAFVTNTYHEERDTCTAYVRMGSAEGATAALSLNGHVLDGKHLRVDRADRSSHSDTRASSVFVGNLPFEVTEEVLREHFAKSVSDVKGVRVVRDKVTGLGKGFAFVVFESEASVAVALKLNGSKFEKRKLRIFKAVDEKKAKKRSSMANRGGANRGGTSAQQKGKGQGGGVYTGPGVASSGGYGGPGSGNAGSGGRGGGDAKRQRRPAGEEQNFQGAQSRPGKDAEQRKRKKARSARPRKKN